MRLKNEAIALIVSTAGIALLFFAQCSFQAKEIRINEMAFEKNGSFISTQGRVSSIKESAAAISFELSDGNRAYAVKFNPSAEERKTIRESLFLKIYGKINSAKKPEIFVEKIMPWQQKTGS
ncbi:MAG: hypothetical protein PHH08_04480 [Candidatus ainarchaeum sp.]|nr:hypothetical protein [Candidatus ainarchaeum sp.]